MRQLIRRILKEEREKDLSSVIKELLNNSIGPKYKGIICKFDAVSPWKMYKDPINRDYQVMVSVIGGVGSNRWPNTMNFVKERDKIVNETWHTIYNFLGVSTDVFLRNVKSCDEVMSEGLHDTSWQNDEGDKITLIDLLDATEKIPVRNISVDKIKPKLLTWDDDDEEIAKIEKSDLQYPILIFVDDDGNFISIIDGHHRAQKAVRHKLKTIKAKLIPINSLPKNIGKVFKHLNKKGESLNEYKMMDLLNATKKIPVRNISEEKLPVTPKELINSLPKDLKKLLFKQWGAKQNPKWHPEGNSLKHIIVVIKRAYKHYPEDPNMIMAALFHDLGKMDTFAINPKTGQPTAYGHEDKSTDYVDQFKDWISTFDETDVDEIKYLVKNHMKINPRTWDVMKTSKKEPISSHSAFNKLKGFTDNLDGGGVITEDDSTTKISKMIKNIGLYSTVKFFGGYENFKELYGEDISKKDKINFINQSIKEKTQVDYRNYIYVSDYLDDDIYYYKDENHSQIITYFYVGFVKINIYKRRGWTYVYDNSKKLPYEELTGDSLNSVFKTMLEIT